MPTESVEVVIEADVSFDLEECDYGVPRSPVWMEPDPNSFVVESVYMFGKEFDEEELYKTFGKQGAEAIMDFLFEEVTYEG